MERENKFNTISLCKKLLYTYQVPIMSGNIFVIHTLYIKVKFEQ